MFTLLAYELLGIITGVPGGTPLYAGPHYVEILTMEAQGKNTLLISIVLYEFTVYCTILYMKIDKLLYTVLYTLLYTTNNIMAFSMLSIKKILYYVIKVQYENIKICTLDDDSLRHQYCTIYT